MIDFPTRIAGWLGGLLFVIAAFGGTWLHGRSKGVESERAVWTQRLADAERAAREASEAARHREQEMHDAIEAVQREYMQRVAAGERDAAGARAELKRVRDSIAARERAAAEAARAAGRVDAAAAERDVLRACTAELVAVAQDADRIAIRLSNLQGYVKSITGY